MGSFARICLQSVLKLVNSVMGMAGMAMILYSLWMVRALYFQMEDGSNIGDLFATLPWFIYTFFGLGVFLCLITCSGHIAAETASGSCLSCYMIVLVFLIMLEAAVTSDVFLNRNWEADFPEDPTGKFNEFKDFVTVNFVICKWIALMIVGAQVLSVILALILRALGPDPGSFYDSDDDYSTARLPLLRNQVQNLEYNPSDSRVIVKSESWNSRTNDKILR